MRLGKTSHKTLHKILAIVAALILLAVLLPRPVSAAITFVQAKGVQSSGQVPSQGITFTSNVTTGNFIVCGVIHFQVGTYTVTDNQGNTYTKDVERVETNDSSAIWRTFAASTGSLTVTVTNTAGDKYTSLSCAEFSGVNSADVLEDTDSDAGVSNSIVDANEVSAAGAGALFIGAMTRGGGGTIAITPDAGWTQIFEEESSSNQPINGVYQIKATAGALTPSWTMDGDANWVAVGAVYNASPTNGAPSSTVPSASQVSGSSAVSFTTTISDSDSDANTSLTVEHSTNGSSWSSSTLGTVTPSEGSVSTSTGSITGIDTDSDGAVALTITWLAGTDLDNTDDTSVFIRVRPYDGTEYGSNAVSSAFALDTADPSAPTISLTTSNPSSIVVTLTASSSDTNFTQYKLFYNTSGSVTTSDTSYTSSTNSALASATLGGGSAVSVSNLNPSTTYYFKLFAFDAYGNSASSAEVSAATTPGGGGSSGGSSVQPPPAPAPTPTPPPVPPPTPAPAPAPLPLPPGTVTEQIIYIVNEIARLQALLDQNQITDPGASFSRSLGEGMSGEDVRRLQIYLNNHGFIVSESGGGSAGHETTYFGQKTKEAVKRFQEAHREEILTPVGFSAGTGYVGSQTREWMNANP